MPKIVLQSTLLLIINTGGVKMILPKTKLHKQAATQAKLASCLIAGLC